jgi:hypothetical protein
LNEIHHTTERFLFEDLQGKKLEVDFDGGEVGYDPHFSNHLEG